MPLSDWLKRFKKNFEIVMIGLDNSGKTTIMNFLQVGDSLETVPTTGIDVKEFSLANTVKFRIVDTAGQKQFRGMWDSYIATTDVIIFVLDIADVDRYAEAKEEFEKIVKNLRKRKNGNKVPIMFVMNKIDLLPSNDHVVDEKKQEISDYFFVQDFLEARNPYQIQPTCALTGQGIFEMIKWIFTASTGHKIETGINFDEFLIFQQGQQVLSKTSILNIDLESVIPGMMDIINNNVSSLSVDEFKLELKDKRILFYNNRELTGVAVISIYEDETRAKTILHDIVDQLFLQNFMEMDDGGKEKIFNTIVVPQIIETQAEKDFMDARKKSE